MGPLLIEHVGGRFLGAFGLTAAEKGQQQDVFGFEDRVALEFGAPMPVGMLKSEQPIAGPFDAGLQSWIDGKNRIVLMDIRSLAVVSKTQLARTHSRSFHLIREARASWRVPGMVFRNRIF